MPWTFANLLPEVPRAAAWPWRSASRHLAHLMPIPGREGPRVSPHRGLSLHLFPTQVQGLLGVTTGLRMGIFFEEQNC